MSNIKVQFDFENSEDIVVRAIKKRIDIFLNKFSNKIVKFVDSINKVIDDSVVVDYLHGDGRGELGIIDVDGVLSKLYGGLRDFTSTEIKRDPNSAGVVMDIRIGEKDALRTATEFIWDNFDGSNFFVVNLFGLIEDGKVSEAGYRNFGVPKASYVKFDSPDDAISRTGEGIMVELRQGQQAFKLPEKHVEGFSRAVIKSNKGFLTEVLKSLMIQSLKESGFDVKG